MLLRDGPGFGLYFCGFELVKRKFGVSENDKLFYNYYGMTDG